MSDNVDVMNHFFGSKKEEQTQPTGDLTSLVNVDELVMIIDRSGSMHSIQEDAEGGINAFIEEQKKAGEANITLVEFDDKHNEVYNRIPISAATPYKLQPRGATALLDAIGKTLATFRDVETTGKKIAVVVTDGHENCSIEWNGDSTKSLISELKEEGWEFIFLAADEQAIRAGQQYGFDLDASIQFDRNAANSSKAGYAAAGLYSASLRSGKTKADSMADMDNFIGAHASIKKLSQ